MAERAGRTKIVTTATPQRLSFAGGGTDMPDYYRLDHGAVLSTAIDKFIYVTVKRHSPLFNENYRLNYSKTEHVETLDDIENDIARECLRLVDVEPPLYINVIADLPASSGLGSSSSFAVGLLHALHVMRGEEVTAGQLAEEAVQVEVGMLARPVGKQDHYAAAFGGLNHFVFLHDDRVMIDPVWPGTAGLSDLFACGLLFWTGMQRDAATILSDQRRNISGRLTELGNMRDMAQRCRDLLLADFDPRRFGAMLDEGWQAKRMLSTAISNDRIDHWYRQAMEAGAYGGKLAGAGGGGFLYLVAAPERQAAVRQALAELTEVRIRYEPRGSRVLSIVHG